MRAHAILKSESLPESKKYVLPTASTVHAMMADEASVEQAQKALQNLGFEVVTTTPLQVTIEGSKAAFEKVFGGKVHSTSGKGKSQSTRGLKKSGTVWNWEEAPQIPDEIKDLVVDVVFPQAVSTQE